MRNSGSVVKQSFNSNDNPVPLREVESGLVMPDLEEEETKATTPEEVPVVETKAEAKPEIKAEEPIV